MTTHTPAKATRWASPRAPCVVCATDFLHRVRGRHLEARRALRAPRAANAVYP